MANATGETREPQRVAFDRRLKLEFHGARITSDAGLLAYRELDDVLGLTAAAASALAEGRRGKNIQHRLLGLLAAGGLRPARRLRGRQQRRAALVHGGWCGDGGPRCASLQAAEPSRFGGSDHAVEYLGDQGDFALLTGQRAGPQPRADGPLLADSGLRQVAATVAGSPCQAIRPFSR